MRPYLSFPRGSRLPSPRILFYASDLAPLANRDLALAEALTEEFDTANVVLATGSVEVTHGPTPVRIEVVKVPTLPLPGAGRPLARERVRKLRQKLISTLFDSFIPDLVLLDMVGAEAELEARLLLERARAFGSATLLGVSHERPGEACFEDRRAQACERCRSRTCASAREALELRERGRRS